MIAKHRGVSIFVTARRMGKPCSEIIEPGYRLKTDIMIRIDLSDMMSNVIISLLHMNDL